MPTQAGPLTERSTAYDRTAPMLESLTRQLGSPSDLTTLRADLVVAFLPVVAHIAARYGGRGEPTEDLRQVGIVGLMGALDRFVPPPDATDLVGAFLAFAVPTVTGEIRRHFRDRTWSMRVPRRMKDLQGPIREAVSVLSRDLHRAPRPSEIAAHLEITREEVVEALQAHSAYNMASLDAPVGPSGATVADLHGDLDTALEQAAYRKELRDALHKLPVRDRQILLLRFFGDKTQTQIADELGVSQMHVSRLLSRSLAVLRQRMGTE